MKLPKPLVIGKFKPSNISILIEKSNRKSSTYINHNINKAWGNSPKEALKHRKICYNGVSYRLNSLAVDKNTLIIGFGFVEFKIRHCFEHIPDYFNLPDEYFSKSCSTLASIKTSDGFYIMITRTGKTMDAHMTGLVGGIMETNLPFSNGYDVFNSLCKEVKEEIGVTFYDISEIYLRSIFLERNTNVCFYFEIMLKIDLDKVINIFNKTKDIEIESIQSFEKDSYKIKITISLHKFWDYKKLCVNA